MCPTRTQSVKTPSIMCSEKNKEKDNLSLFTYVSIAISDGAQMLPSFFTLKQHCPLVVHCTCGVSAASHGSDQKHGCSSHGGVIFYASMGSQCKAALTAAKLGSIMCFSTLLCVWWRHQNINIKMALVISRLTSVVTSGCWRTAEEGFGLTEQRNRACLCPAVQVAAIVPWNSMLPLFRTPGWQEHTCLSLSVCLTSKFIWSPSAVYS